MNAVDVSFEGAAESLCGGGAESFADSARAFALDALGRLEKNNWDLSLLFCDDIFIRSLNRDYRDRDEPTDVLSFEQGADFPGSDGELRHLAGDIAISLEALDRNVADFGVSRGEELRRLVLHGILHLSGMDHEDNDPARPMLVLQERLLAELGRGSGAFA